jgi:hypothetical protein
MAILNPPPETPEPKGEDRDVDSKQLVQQYMFRQYWSMKWWLLALVSCMSIYTINYDRWIPGIGLTGFASFAFVMLGIGAGMMVLNTEFMKAIRAKQTGTTFDWTKVYYTAWGCTAGNLIMLYWGIVMVYVTWFSDDSTITLIQ